MTWKLEQFRVSSPVGQKPCTQCGSFMRTLDKHARCQKCRNSGGYLASKYKKNCQHCGREYMAAKSTSVFCGQQCANKSAGELRMRVNRR